MLQISNLNLNAGKFSLRNISISIPKGCCHVILGQTGNGKTLLLEAIAGFRNLESGKVMIDNMEITKTFPEKKGISYVSQDLALFPHLNVKDNIRYSRRFKNNSIRSEGDIAEIIQCLHLDHILDRAIRNLSGGEKQRVALARALVSGNTVLLLDEPFSALHFSLKRNLWNMINEIKKKFDLSILLVTHDLVEANFLADSISIMENGQVLQTGTKKDIFEYPEHLGVAMLTGHYNYFLGVVCESNEKECRIDVSSIGKLKTTNSHEFTTGELVTIAIKTNKIVLLSTDVALENTYLFQVKDIFEMSHYNQVVLSTNNLNNETNEVVVDYYEANDMKIEFGLMVNIHFPKKEMLLFRR